MNLIDCHTHTNNSPDGESCPDAMALKAASLGLSAYAITDHCEVNRWFSYEYYNNAPNEYDTYGFGESFEKSMSDNTRLKNKYSGRLNVLCGIELGQAVQKLALSDEIISDKRLDFVIGSIHQIIDCDDFAFLKYDNENVYPYLDEYFNELYKLCVWDKLDILAHLTYPLRYITGEQCIEVDMTRYEEIIRQCFKTLIQNGKGIEINTSGYRQKYGKPLPDLYWVKLFHEMGGEIISLGSDAHRTSDLGKNLSDGAELALSAGFKYLCYFQERKPHFISIK